MPQFSKYAQKLKKNKKLGLMPEFTKCANKFEKFFLQFGAYTPIFKTRPKIFEKI
jgi:hypothetical protein